mmetsp:Transcript_43796/g.141260  ORF Transcript_43796/g.141260 Transcript_43796/m.141260 type:complete len:159 (-) Transcript_43796:293-769(-)
MLACVDSMRENDLLGARAESITIIVTVFTSILAAITILTTILVTILIPTLVNIIINNVTFFFIVVVNILPLIVLTQGWRARAEPRGTWPRAGAASPRTSRRRRLARTARSDLGRGPLPARRGHPTREGRRALHGRGRAQAVVPTATWPRAACFGMRAT